MQFEEDLDLKIKEIMTPKEKLVTASLGVKMEEAKKTLHQYRIEKLPVVDSEGKVKGSYHHKRYNKDDPFPFCQ